MNESVDIHKIWSALLPAVEKSLTKPIYETLISSTKPISFKEGILEIGIPHNVIKEWLSKHCHTILEEEIKTISPKIEKIVFTSGHSDLFQTPNLNDPGRISEIKDNVARSVQFAYLNPRYTFDSFVVGNGNRFAHAAALAVAEAPATAYNPFGYSVLKTNSKARVLYITCEMFTNELITSIKEGKMQEFRNKYRTIDLLMVDDIQFLAGKERTQEEFFHTFNTLHDANKQIIVSSDRPPKEIPTLEERLRSRFEWGLIADIQSPDFETRIAILRKKAEFVDLIVPDEVTQFIASRIDTNIRELEGALIRVIAFASLSNAEVSISLVEQVLKDITSPANTRTSVSVDLIKKATAEYYSVKIDDMSAKIRTKEIATARQVAMFLCRELTPSSLPKIGEEFGGRDHTTVIHANEKIKNALKFDKDISEAVKNIKQNLKKYAL